ncbi:MAG: glutamate--tRNA ligase family protein, partial [Lysobacterales bacterium]
DGFLPHALLNYLIRLGWSHGDQEIFSREEMIALFDAADVNKSASRFVLEKLSWLNQQYLKNDDPLELAPHFEWQLRAAGIDPAHGPDPVDVIVALRDRAKTLKEMAEKARVWYAPLQVYDEQAVAKHLKTPTARAALEAARERFAALAEWTVESIHAAIESAATSIGEGMGKVAQPLRVALTGTQVSPSIDHTVFLTGRDEALRRIEAALAKVG